MNFLVQIFAPDDGTDEDFFELTKKLSNHEDRINTCIDEIYKKYREWPHRNQTLRQNVTHLCSNVSNLKVKAENVMMLEIEKQNSRVTLLKEELNRAQIESGLVEIIKSVQEKMLIVQDHENECEYEQAAMDLKKIEGMIDTLPKKELNNIVELLNKRIVQQRTSLIEHIVNDELCEYLILKEGKNGVLQTNTLKISKSQELSKIFNTLKICNVLHSQFTLFSKLFWQLICKPIMSNITNVHQHEDEDFYVLTVSIKKTQLHRSYKEVFDKLLQIFRFLNAHLDIQIDCNNRTISYFGKELRVEFTEMILKDVLGGVLPTNNKERDKYKKVIEDTNELEAQLVKFKFLSKENNPLLEYINNMNNLLANIHTEEYSAKAIALMKKDLHDMIEVGVHCEPNNPLTGDQFPQCYVSKSCNELLNLAKEILDQALVEPHFFAARLICALQSFFYQYGSIVYAHHEKLLQNIPQQVVLFRNNCMYLAHQLSQLNETYGDSFPREVLPVPPLFKDQPHQLRTVGGDTFLGYIETHIKSMERTLVDYKFESNQLSEDMTADVSKSIRQCLRQYELLRTVWHKILPHPVYNKTLGYLLNTFCKRIIDTVVNASDILVANADLLTEICKIILARGPKLFTDPDEVNLYVELWQKLNELVFILGANLVEITERWEHGPLSMQFTSEEVKNLIKALFQSTSRRTDALNRIVSY